MSDVRRMSDTRPLRVGQLVQPQVEMLRRMVDTLGAIVSVNERDAADAQRVEQKRRAPPRANPWGRPDARREPRMLFIDGLRGSGKTSLMLTLIETWRQVVFGDGGGTDFVGQLNERQKTHLRSVRFLPMIDLHPMPEGMPLYAWLLAAFGPVVKHLDRALAGNGDHRGGPHAAGPFHDAHPRSLADRLRMLQHAAIASWDAGRAAASDSQEDWVLNRADQLESWWELEVEWTSFVDAVVEAVERAAAASGEAPPKGPGWVLALPIDDLDLYGGDGRQVVLALRRLWHPRVVFVITGEAGHLTQTVQRSFACGLTVGGQLSPADHDQARDLARTLVDKVLPAPIRFRTSDISVLQALKNGLDKGIFGKVAGPALIVGGAPDLIAGADQGGVGLDAVLEAYARGVRDHNKSTVLRFRQVAQLVDELHAVLPTGDARTVAEERLVVALVTWARTLQDVFEPEPLEWDPPTFRLRESRKLELVPQLVQGHRLKNEPIAGSTTRSAPFMAQLETRTIRALGAGEGLPRDVMPGIVPILLDVAANYVDVRVDGLLRVVLDEASPVLATVSTRDRRDVARVPWPTATLDAPGPLVWLTEQVRYTFEPKAVASHSRLWMVCHWVVWNLVIAGIDPTELEEGGRLAPAVAPDEWWERILVWVDEFYDVSNPREHTWLTAGLPLLACPEAGLGERVAAKVLELAHRAIDKEEEPQGGLEARLQRAARRWETLRSARHSGVPDASALLDGAAPWSVWAQMQAKHRHGGPLWWLHLQARPAMEGEVAGSFLDRLAALSYEAVAPVGVAKVQRRAIDLFTGLSRGRPTGLSPLGELLARPPERNGWVDPNYLSKMGELSDALLDARPFNENAIFQLLSHHATDQVPAFLLSSQVDVSVRAGRWTSRALQMRRVDLLVDGAIRVEGDQVVEGDDLGIWAYLGDTSDSYLLPELPAKLALFRTNDTELAAPPLRSWLDHHLLLQCAAHHAGLPRRGSKPSGSISRAWIRGALAAWLSTTVLLMDGQRGKALAAPIEPTEALGHDLQAWRRIGERFYQPDVAADPTWAAWLDLLHTFLEQALPADAHRAFDGSRRRPVD